MSMRTRRLGTQGLEVSQLGLGCMGLTWAYGAADPDEATATVRRAVELGVTFFDTAEIYGPWNNEELVGRALAGVRERVIIATKFGFSIDADGRTLGADSSAANVKRACEGSLRRLGVDHIDLYYQHRVDPKVPIEETVGAMAELVKEGKVRYLGLSEAGVGTIRRAHAVHPITVLQTEYSLWTRDVEDRELAACRELGIGFVAYSPLGRGALTGALPAPEALAVDDRRRDHPRFAPENWKQNQVIVEAVRTRAARKGCAPAQMALAWVLAQGDDIVPIPGTKRRRWLEQNVAAAKVSLNDEDRLWFETMVPKGVTAGLRYPESAMGALDTGR